MVAVKKYAPTVVLVAGCVIGTGLLAGTPAKAQNQPAPTQITPPTPQKPGDPPAVMSLLGTAAVIGACVGAVMLAPKRGHQD